MCLQRPHNEFMRNGVQEFRPFGLVRAEAGKGGGSSDKVSKDSFRYFARYELSNPACRTPIGAGLHYLLQPEAPVTTKDRTMTTETELDIVEEINVRGTLGQVRVGAVIDTGALMSILPSSLLDQVGAEWTGETQEVAGWNGETSWIPTAIVEIRFPKFGWRGTRLTVLAEERSGILMGKDILNLLSLIIDTKAWKLRLKDGEQVEAASPPPGAVVLPSGGTAYNVPKGYERRLRQLAFEAMKPMDPADIPPADPDAPLPTTPRVFKVKPKS